MELSETSVKFFEGADDPGLKELAQRNEVVQRVDIFQHCLDELFEIEHPWIKPGNQVFERTKNKFFADWRAKGPFESQGVWVYYPWSKVLIHFPDEEVYSRLRTSRNRNLITEGEQKIFQDKCVGIAGMSVGSNILNALVLIGGPRRLKISDMDIISAPNLNRIMAPATSVGLNKAVYFARRSLEVDPFLKIVCYPEGLTKDRFREFFEEPKLDLFIEEMDDPYLKIQTRKVARESRIPVIMAADNGDGALIDIERFDLDPNRPLFHGNLNNVVNLEEVTEDISFSQKLAIIANMVRLEQTTPRAQSSLEEVGTILNTWPQLGTAALTCGVALAFIARKILLGEEMPSGRYHLSWEENLVPDYLLSSNRRTREQRTKKIMNRFKAFQDFLKEAQKQ